jgi:type III secretion protein Q
MIAQVLALPSVTRAEAKASRLRCAPRAALKLLAGPLRLSLDDKGTSEYGPERMCTSFRWGKDLLELRCPATLIHEILQSLEPELQFASLPPPLAGLLLDAALLALVMAFERSSGREVAILSMEKDLSDKLPEGLGLILEDGAKRWHLHLSSVPGQNCERRATAALLSLWPIAPRAMPKFPLPAALRVGVTCLPYAAVASLRQDDAVLLQSHEAEGARLVIAESWTAAAYRLSDGWCLGEAPNPAVTNQKKEWLMHDDNPGLETAANPPLSSPDELPIKLVFDIGQLDIKLAEFRELGPGSVLELGRSRSELVRISAHGRLIGHGELVEVEGAIGVRVVRLFDFG